MNILFSIASYQVSVWVGRWSWHSSVNEGLCFASLAQISFDKFVHVLPFIKSSLVSMYGYINYYLSVLPSFIYIRIQNEVTRINHLMNPICWINENIIWIHMYVILGSKIWNSRIFLNTNRSTCIVILILYIIESIFM